MLHLRLLFMDVLDRAAQLLLVVFHLGADILPRLAHQVAMTLPLHAALQAERDEQPNRDRRQVNQNVAPAMRRLMRRMHIEHRLVPSVCVTHRAHRQTSAAIVLATIPRCGIGAVAGSGLPLNACHPERSEGPAVPRIVTNPGALS
jgi:hypothetical protein